MHSVPPNHPQGILAIICTHLYIHMNTCMLLCMYVRNRLFGKNSTCRGRKSATSQQQISINTWEYVFIHQLSVHIHTTCVYLHVSEVHQESSEWRKIWIIKKFMRLLNSRYGNETHAKPGRWNPDTKSKVSPPVQRKAQDPLRCQCSSLKPPNPSPENQALRHCDHVPPALIASL